MGIVIRQSIKSSIASYAGFLLGAINTLLLFPRLTDPDEFGITRVVLSIAFILAQFSEFGTSNMQSRYLSYIVDRHGDSKGMYVWYFKRVIFVFLAIITATFIFREEIIDKFQERSALIESFFFLAIPLAGSILIFNLLEAYSRARLRIVVPTILRELYIRLFILLSLVLLYLQVVDFEGFMWLFLFAYVTAFAILGAYVLYLDNGLTIPKKDYVETSVMKDMAFYGLVTIFGTTVWQLVNELDALMIGMLDSLANVAIYATALYFVTVIQLPQRYLHRVTIPLLATALNKDNREEIDHLYKKVALNEYIIGLVLFLLLWFNLDLLYFFMPEIYREGAGVVFTIGILRLYDMSTGLSGDIIIYSKHYRFTMFTGLLLLVLTISMNYLLIPIYGILGAAMATAIAVFVFNTINVILAYWKYRLLPFSPKMLWALLTAAAIFAVIHYLPMPDNLFLQSFIRSSIIVAVYLSVAYGFKFSPDLNGLASEALAVAQKWAKRKR